MTVEAPDLVATLPAPQAGEEVDLYALVDQIEARFGDVEEVVRAFVDEPDRFARLRRDAADLLTRWPHVEDRPPLFGVPIGIKDVFHVDGFETHAGSLLSPQVLAGPEGGSVTALKDAGALIVGKTVTTEFAYFAPGPTRNPHDPARTPGGSSSGSAAAVAAGMVSAAIGTQTIGSITRPASFCGVVGYKPTLGRISADGMIHLAPSFDHVGVLARELGMLRQTAEVLVKGWRASMPNRRPRLGVLTGSYLEQASLAACQVFRRAVSGLSDAGWDVVDVPGFETMERVDVVHRTILAADVSRVHEPWFDRYRANYDPRTVELIETGRSLGTGEVEECRAEREAIASSVSTWTNEHGVDLWLSPAAPGPAPKGLDSTGDPCMNRLWTQLGVPTLCLPIRGGVADLPFGLQIVAKRGADEQLFAWAEEIARVVSTTEGDRS